MTADLFEEHRLLIAAADALLVAVRRNPPARSDEITQLRVRVGTLALAHLRHEDEMIIKPLTQSGLVDQLPHAAAMMSELRHGHGQYSNHVGTWTVAAIEADRAGYEKALVRVIGILHSMIEREERLLYWPALKLLHGDEAAQTGKAG